MTRLTLASLSLALLVASPAPASAQVDVTGVWAVTLESPQGPVTIDATMKQAGEELTGTIVSPLGSVDFKGKVVEDAIAVVYTMDMQGNAVEITMNGKVEGESIAGTFNFGGLGEVPWTAKRKPPSSSPAAVAAAPSAPVPAGAPGDVSGKWDITFNIGDNPAAATATLAQAGEAVSGTITSQAGETQVSGTMAGPALKLAFTIETPQGPLEISMIGSLAGDSLTGKAALVGLGEVDWTGKRAK